MPARQFMRTILVAVAEYEREVRAEPSGPALKPPEGPASGSAAASAAGGGGEYGRENPPSRRCSGPGLPMPRLHAHGPKPAHDLPAQGLSFAAAISPR